MTTLQERQTADLVRVPNRTRIAEWTLGVTGILAAALGAWMFYVPATWFLGGLAETWYLGMFIGGGVLIALATGMFARQMFRVDHGWTARVLVTTLVAVVALAAAVVFATILII